MLASPRPRMRPPPVDRHRLWVAAPRRRHRRSPARSAPTTTPTSRCPTARQGRPGAPRGQLAEHGAGFEARSWPRPPQGVDDPAVQERLTEIAEFAASQDGVTAISPYDNPPTDQRRRHDRLRPARGTRPRLRGGHRARPGHRGVRRRASRPSRASQIEYGGDLFSEFELPESEIYGILAAVIILHRRLRLGAGDGPADRHRAVRHRRRLRARRRCSAT